MRKILNWIFVVVLSLTSVFALTSCKKEAKAADLLHSYIFEQDGKIVSQDFSVPAQLTIKDKSYTLDWKSNNDAVKVGEKVDTNYKMEVTRPEAEVTVTLTATLTVSKKNTASKDFTVRVVPVGVYDIIDDFEASGVFEQNNGTVSESFALVTEHTVEGKKATISWSSNSGAIVVSEDSKTATVKPNSKDIKVTLTAKFTLGEDEVKVPYTVTVVAPKTAYEKLMYWYNNDGVTQVMSGWVVAIADKYSSNYGNVSLYILDDTKQGGYYLFRAKIKESEASQLEIGVHVTATGMQNTSYSGLMETTGKGGQLVVDEDQPKLDIATTVHAIDNDLVANAQSLYYRTSTMVSLTGWKVKEIGKTPDEGKETVLTLTRDGVDVAIRYSKYIEATKGAVKDDIKAMLKDIKVDDYVNIKGLLAYYNEDNTKYDQKSYQILITGTDSVVKTTAPAEGALEGVDVAKAMADVAKKFQPKYVSDVTITLPSKSYHTDITWAFSESNICGEFAKIEGDKLVVDIKKAFTIADSSTVTITAKFTKGEYSTLVYYTFDLEKLTDKEVAEKSLEAFDITKAPYKDMSIELPTTHKDYAGSELTYTLGAEYQTTTIADGKLNIVLPQETAEEVKITVKATYKGQEATKEVTINVAPMEITSIADVLKAEIGASFTIKGVVVATGSKLVEGELSKESWVITDGTATMFCYDKLALELGQEITVRVTRGANNGFPQISKPDVIKVEAEKKDAVQASGTVVAKTAAEIEALIDANNKEELEGLIGKYLKISGLTKEKGDHINLTSDASKDAKINLYIGEKLFGGEEVEVLCFIRGINTKRDETKAVTTITVQCQSINYVNGKPQPVVPDTKLDQVAAPVSGTQYLFGLYNDDKQVFVNGTFGKDAGWCLGTTRKAEEAAKVTYTEVEGGCTLTLTVGQKTMYVYIYTEEVQGKDGPYNRYTAALTEEKTVLTFKDGHFEMTFGNSVRALGVYKGKDTGVKAVSATSKDLVAAGLYEIPAAK